MGEGDKRSKKIITYALSVDTQVIQLAKENPTRKRLYVANLGSNAVYVLSAQNLKYTDGIPVAASTGTYKNKTTTAAMWIVAATGSNDVRVEEDTD
jgi:YVTN family beta-propeller protein